MRNKLHRRTRDRDFLSSVWTFNRDLVSLANHAGQHRVVGRLFKMDAFFRVPFPIEYGRERVIEIYTLSNVEMAILQKVASEV